MIDMAAQLICGVRAAISDGTNVIVDEVSLLPPDPGEVTVRVLASRICHSDLDVIDGRSPIPAPVVLGHEAAGVVERIGDNVDSVDVGDEAMISSLTPCGDCPSCRAGRPSRCPEAYGRSSFPFRWRGTVVRSYANVSSFASHVTVRASQLIGAAGIPATHSSLVGCAVSTGSSVPTTSSPTSPRLQAPMWSSSAAGRQLRSRPQRRGGPGNARHALTRVIKRSAAVAQDTHARLHACSAFRG